jgi:hypothetical protein
MTRNEHRKRNPARRSTGVILRGRADGLHLYDDEISTDGGKAKLHRMTRRLEDRAWRAEAANEVSDD